MGGDHPIGPYQSLTSDVRIESVVNKALSDAKQVSSSAEVLPGPQSPVSFQDYTQGLRLKLSQRAREKVGKEGIRGEVDFSFTLLANGELKGEPRIVSATDKRLIKPIMDSIRESSPFPPFPECLAKQEETFHLAIAFE
jgi:hypothetical protein